MYSCLRVTPFPWLWDGPGDWLLGNRLWQKWCSHFSNYIIGAVTSTLRVLSLWFFLLTFMAPAVMMWAALWKGPLGKRLTAASGQQPWRNGRPQSNSSWRTESYQKPSVNIETIKPWENCSLSQYFVLDLETDSEPEDQRDHACPYSWLLGIMR